MNEITYIANVIMDFLIEGQCNIIFPICRSGFAKYNNRKSIKYINNTTNKGSTALQTLSGTTVSFYGTNTRCDCSEMD